MAATGDKIGSIDQFLLVLYASKDTRLTACDLAVLLEIVDRYQKDDEHGIASGQAHLMRETGRSDGAVQTSRRRLVEFGYVSIGQAGRGSRGTEYQPNFNWSRAVHAVIKAETDSRKAARQSKRKRASGAEPRPTDQGGGGERRTAPLRDLVWLPTAPLPNTVGQSIAPHTYGGPSAEGTYGRLADGVGCGLAADPPPAANDNEATEEWRRVRITAAERERDDGEDLLRLDMEGAAGEPDEHVYIVWQSYDQGAQAAGQVELGRIVFAALGRGNVDNESELVGAEMMLQGRNYDFKYAPVAKAA